MPVRLRSLPAALMVAAVLALTVAVPAQASNDPLFSRQWGLAQVGAPQSWGVSTGAGITIGVVDTGVDLNHEDLAGKVVASANCIGGTCRTGAGQGQDDNGHGTHVSGIATASKDNGKGIAGVAPDAKLVVAKALDRDGSGSATDIAVAIQWVVSRGAKVVNLSFGPDGLTRLVFGSGSTLTDAINKAWDLGAVPVLASGNSNLFGGGSQTYGSLNAMVVGATDRAGRVAAYSTSLGTAKWGLVAPGGAGGGSSDPAFADNNVVSTWLGNSYAAVGGTSMAAPHVAGALALLMAKGFSRDAAIQRLLETADRSVNCGSGCQGRLDVGHAVGAASSASSPAPLAGNPGAARAPTATTRRTRATAAPAPAPSTTVAAPTTTGAPLTTVQLPSLEPPSTASPPLQVALGRQPQRRNDDGPNRVPMLAAATLLTGAAATGVALKARALRGGAGR